MKSRIRKLAVLLVVFSWMSICTGCSAGYNQPGRDDITAMEAETEIDENLTVVGVTQVGAESDWRIANTDSIKEALTPENGFYMIFNNAQQKQENQIKAVRSFILQEVDYIVLAPIVVSGWESVLQEARDAGIPVILVDRSIEVEDDTLYTTLVGTDSYSEGRNAGMWLENYLEQQGRREEEINLVILQGTEGASAQIGRTEGFTEILKEHENWNLLEMANGDFTQAKGREAMESLLEKYDDIDVVISENDNMTFGAIDAIEAAGRSCGPGKDMVMISFDAVSAALDCMIEGKINAVFECNPLHGPLLLETLRKLSRGEEVDKIQYVEETYFDTSMDLEEIKKTRAY